jgi:hypothetical protein
MQPAQFSGCFQFGINEKARILDFVSGIGRAATNARTYLVQLANFSQSRHMTGEATGTKKTHHSPWLN